mmetsp:Transcript_39161/g.87665  ORF Transcript_39161/g.87665 Transcript_39161/m.87665 type:complete len:207 (+) Transcript_39161:2617-3237(+)
MSLSHTPVGMVQCVLLLDHEMRDHNGAASAMPVFAKHQSVPELSICYEVMALPPHNLHRLRIPTIVRHLDTLVDNVEVICPSGFSLLFWDQGKHALNPARQDQVLIVGTHFVANEDAACDLPYSSISRVLCQANTTRWELLGRRSSNTCHQLLQDQTHVAAGLMLLLGIDLQVVCPGLCHGHATMQLQVLLLEQLKETNVWESYMS